MPRRNPSFGSVAQAKTPSAIAHVVRGRKRALAGITLSALISGFTEALFLITVTKVAFAIADGADRLEVGTSRSVSTSAALLVAGGLLLMRIALAIFNVWQNARLSAAVVADNRSDLGDAFLNTSWQVQQSQQAGSLQQYLLGYAGAAGGLIGGIGQLAIMGANLTAMLSLAIAVDPVGAVVLVVSVAVLGLMLRPLRNRVREKARQSVEASMEFATSANEVSQLGLELHVFQVQKQAKRRVEKLVEENRRREVGLGFASGITTPVYTGLAYMALLAALGMSTVASSRSLSDLGAVMLIMLRSLGYGQALQNSYMRVIGNLPPIEDLLEKLELFRSNRHIDGGQPVGFVGSLSAHRVSFSYTPGFPVLHDVSFTIEPNEIAGIVGPSGSGKSTLVQLLLGLREPDEGRILAAGRDINDFARSAWARKVTFVPQEAHLITGTIADNIRFLRDDVRDEDVEHAARLAHLHDEIMAVPGGYDRQLGADGARLSGGQQQRLCIARALVEQPDVLILDEPTSALDVRSEHLIRTTLLGLKKQMTVIVIAHRLSTLDICERLMVIQDGRLIGFDTPANLEQSNEFYREALQLSGIR